MSEAKKPVIANAPESVFTNNYTFGKTNVYIINIYFTNIMIQPMLGG